MVGCQTRNAQTCGPFPDAYQSLVHSYVSQEVKDSEKLEWKVVTAPRQGSQWRGVLFGGNNPCWVVDVTADKRDGSGGYVAYQRTIYIKNDRVIGSRAFHPEGERFITSAQSVNYEELSKMQPFEARVESVDIEHPFFVTTTACIGLRRADDGKALDVEFASPDQFVLSFARSLHLGETYSFPQAFDDYAKKLSAGSNGPASSMSRP